MGKPIFKGLLPGYYFQDLFRIFLASPVAYAPQNFCLDFNFDDEQVCQKMFQNSEISDNLGIRSESSH